MLIIVPNETDTVSRDTTLTNNNYVSIPNTPGVQILEPVKPLPLSPPSKSLQIVNPVLPVHKGYLWIPEHELGTSQKILGNVGDPKNILNHHRQPKNHANLATHLTLDPKTYIQALKSPDGEEWMKAINLELKNIAKNQV
ncbi:hypothetical protein O181_039074 [Austropuccinia psidii MF-1]|uniref:Uncharacterized protein n=1 Tax=Austropuccinia psidii MF-1 TaxID=1389203 RepID=A0A9Q3HE68_9BASI|nr:hypothetical protein [Austropuccinia psidii MF-1]